MHEQVNMKVYFYGKGRDEVPHNISNLAHALFTKVHIEYLPDNNVRLLIPSEEESQVQSFQAVVRELILKIGEGNSALAQKLARHHRINL